MQNSQIRKKFLDFFENKLHRIVPSAPMVVKNDPSLMFTNAGMNQFKDIFLGNIIPENSRVANTQKCLRVSGKHNDLEEVGHDTYHHTMFEMLGNWSFGSKEQPEKGYFKKEAIAWAMEFLTGELEISKDLLYATVFEGDPEIGLPKDTESENYWKNVLDADKILEGSKKDNFWEMGETGPCGPCSEIHIDLRPENERTKTPGHLLVNKDHPLVIEIWNLVFIQYNRLASGKLESLPAKHVDTGMGFERLCMVVQGKKSNYDTDIFQPLLQQIAQLSKKKYGQDDKLDIAMRVIADHLRAVSFSIADGQLPSNNKAGYVIRRILRRAIRYAYSFLDQTDPFIYKLVPVLAESMGNAYPELNSQKELIEKVIKEEETTFLKTLETGIKLLGNLAEEMKKQNKSSIDGKDAFTLYDTYGFPVDLTELIAAEYELTVDLNGFNRHMQIQKNRSRNDGKLSLDDWTEVADSKMAEFVGYDQTDAEVKITKYRKITQKGKVFYQLVFNLTPFYAESGGQVGDSGFIKSETEKIEILDTQKENELTVHITKSLPVNLSDVFHAEVNKRKRMNTENNHSATHLLHKALRNILGTHVEQKGSLVHPDYLRFDFSHFQKLSKEEIEMIEDQVNNDIRNNYPLEENRAVPYNEAVQKGAIALFGEKYADTVRVIKFGDSIELCGGTHARTTGQIGLFKILSESSIAAGIRRIEAITGEAVGKRIRNLENTLDNISQLVKAPVNVEKAIKTIVEENNTLKKKVEIFEKEKLKNLKTDLLHNSLEKNDRFSIISKKVEMSSPAELKDLAFQLRGERDNLVCILGAEIEGKAHLVIMIADSLVKTTKLNAGEIIRKVSGHIQGGGGGQPFLATAGGKNPGGIREALQSAKKFVAEQLSK
jgi:alanyl-tRNA synthetase